MYSGPLCNFCDAAKRLLNRNNIPFKEINIAIEDEYPNRQGPTVVISFDSNYSGPKSEKIMEELANNDPKIFVGGGLNDGHAYMDEVCVVVHRIDAPLIPLPVMGCVPDPV